MIADLSVDDIRILNDHFAVRRIRQSSRAEDLPLEIGLRIDVSDSVQKTVAPEKQARPCSSIKSCGRGRIGRS